MKYVGLLGFSMLSVSALALWLIKQPNADLDQRNNKQRGHPQASYQLKTISLSGVQDTEPTRGIKH